jgi:methyltransferase
LPLCLGLPWLALIFSAANAILLWIRIRAETIALDRANPCRTRMNMTFPL